MANYQNVTPIQLGQAAITTSATVVYIVPSSALVYLKDIDICNTNSTPVTVNVYLVPSGSTASTSNALFYGAPIPGNSTLQWTGTQLLLTSQTVQVSASATGCTIIASGGQAV